jgi:hemerythrin-like domain-containing protein
MVAAESSRPQESSQDPIFVLVREHRVLQGVADAFETYGAALAIGSAQPEDLLRFCIFFREFGAMIHHEKEERIAGAALSLHGYQPGGGPRAHLHDEHEQEHAMLLHLIRFAMTADSWEQKDRDRIRSLTTSYGTHLRTHLTAEEANLYTAIRSTLTTEQLASVARKLARFDEDHNLSGQLDWLLELGSALQAKYAPESRSS